ncbi:hypothetical protein Csp1_19920 [Corynebacterium provencense]|uniref:Uncharacterized protein n=1 Tax=Corynebacterium provencense TaxID=1737425 RepID=A0A2Z3YU82_9CORY|nr:hypothetical protein Csp1_19920 [Corynebacterium provencense]
MERRHAYSKIEIESDLLDNGSHIASFAPNCIRRWRKMVMPKDSYPTRNYDPSEDRKTSKQIVIKMGLRFHVFHLKSALALLALVLMANFADSSNLLSDEASSKGSFLAIIIALLAAFFSFPTLFGSSSENGFIRGSLFKYRLLFSAISILSLILLFAYQGTSNHTYWMLFHFTSIGYIVMIFFVGSMIRWKIFCFRLGQFLSITRRQVVRVATFLISTLKNPEFRLFVISFSDPGLYALVIISTLDILSKIHSFQLFVVWHLDLYFYPFFLPFFFIR